MGSKRKSPHGNMDKNSSEYREKRQKNNNAVKRSRDKTKQKSMEASERVTKLENDNKELETANQDMTEARKHLQDMLLKHADALHRLSPKNQQALMEVIQKEAPVDLEKIRSIIREIHTM